MKRCLPSCVRSRLFFSLRRASRRSRSPKSDEIVPNENLVVEGIPRFPPIWPSPWDATASFAPPPSPAGTRTEREMLIETRFSDTFQVHR